MRQGCRYIGVLLLTLLITLMHPGEFARFLLGFEVLLFLCLLLQVQLLGRRISVRLRCGSPYGQKHAPVRVEVELKNAGRLPAPEVKVRLGCRECRTGSVHYYTGAAMLDGGGSARLEFYLESDYCEALFLWIEEARVPDYFGGFSGKCTVAAGKREISILPAGDLVLPPWEAAGSTGSAVTHGRYCGEDTSGSFDIRCFRQGDTLRRVHWKLYAKTDELLVRDMAGEEDSRLLLLLELHNGQGAAGDGTAASGEDGTPCEVWDHFMEVVAALSAALLEQGCIHDVIWNDAGSGSNVTCLPVQDDEERKAMLARLLHTGGMLCAPAGHTTDWEEYKRNESYREALRVDLAGNICRIQGK